MTFYAYNHMLILYYKSLNTANCKFLGFGKMRKALRLEGFGASMLISSLTQWYIK